MEGSREMELRHDRRAIELFIQFDRLGALGGLVLVIGAIFVLNLPLLWFIAAAIVFLCVALTVADRLLSEGRLFLPLILVAVGNWITAVVVSTVVPFLWPVMALTVLMPLVLSTPYLARRQVALSIGTSALVAGLVCMLGLLNDDGGVLPDIEDELELLAVVSSLMVQIAPIGLIVWQNNLLQRGNLERATALNSELDQSQRRLAASRRRVVAAADTERRRIERDLHDGAQQRLVAIGVRLRLLESLTGEDAAVNEQVSALVAELDEAVEEVRELARGIYPPLLQSRGLVDALSAVARRSPLAITNDLEPVGRLDPSTETALYFTALEALTNAAKHAPDSSVDLSLAVEGSQIRLTVTDDGPGFEPDEETRTQGTHNMGDRVAASGGELTISSAPGQGTTVVAVVPAAGSASIAEPSGH